MVVLFLELRLVNGPNSASGRIEVYHRGTWGTVCDDGFQQYAGDMICKELGFQWVQPQWLRILIRGIYCTVCDLIKQTIK